MGLVTLEAKAVVVVLVIVAVLYVFISPLPEMAATNAGRSLVFLLPLLLLVFLLPASDLFLSLVAGRRFVIGQSLSRSLLCSMLC